LILANSVAPTPLASATKTIVLTPSETPTITPTLPTPTYTSTPTLIYFGPTSTESDTPLPTDTFSLNANANGFLTPQMDGFTSVRVSGNQIFYGRCLPNSVDFTATVADPSTETSVLLFVRLVDTKTGEYTDWGGGAIMNGKRGTFTYTLGFQNIPHYH